MRWFDAFPLCGVLGCTSLNSAYGDAASSGEDNTTTGRSTSTTDVDRTTDTARSASVGSSQGSTTEDLTATSTATPTTTGASSTADTRSEGPNDTGEVDTGEVDTGVVDTGVVDTGVADTGISEDPVLFLYATEVAFEPGPGSNPVQFCLETEPSEATTRCEGETRVPLLSAAGDVFEDALDIADGLSPGAAVHGIGDEDGLDLIADAAGEMYNGLQIPLAQASVGLSEDEQFWTGEAASNCQGWVLSDGSAVTGFASSTGSQWRDFDTADCADSLRILCACASSFDPFG